LPFHRSLSPWRIPFPLYCVSTGTNPSCWIMSTCKCFVLPATQSNVLLAHSPFTGSSLMGLANAVFNILCRGLLPLNQLGVAIITLSAISTFLYSIAALIAYMKEHERLETLRRERRHLYPDDGAPLITDDEMQRLQFSKLLQRKDTAPSPEALHETYRIDLPNNTSPQGERGRSALLSANSRAQQTLSPYRGRSTWEARSTQLAPSPEPASQARDKRGTSGEG
jgi:hypothetical protein